MMLCLALRRHLVPMVTRLERFHNIQLYVLLKLGLLVCVLVSMIREVPTVFPMLFLCLFAPNQRVCQFFIVREVSLYIALIVLVVFIDRIIETVHSLHQQRHMLHTLIYTCVYTY